MRRPLAVAVPARAPMSNPEGPEGSVRAAFGHVRPIFIPVHLDGLVLDAVVDFHLHLQTSPGHFVLFRGPDLEFTTAHHRRLLANKVETLWLKGDERRRYEQYVERHLESLLGNPQIATPRKVELLQSAAQTTLEAVMVDPRHTEAVPRSRTINWTVCCATRRVRGTASVWRGSTITASSVVWAADCRSSTLRGVAIWGLPSSVSRWRSTYCS